MTLETKINMEINEPRHEKMCLRGFSTRLDSNQPAQLQRLARVLEFWIYKFFFFCLFVLGFYGPVNNEVMLNRSVNSGTIPGQA